jgi:hypothetical protein
MALFSRGFATPPPRDGSHGHEQDGVNIASRSCVVTRAQNQMPLYNGAVWPRLRAHLRHSSTNWCVSMPRSWLCRCRAHKETRPASHQNPYGIVGGLVA